MGSVDTAVGEVLQNYLEENPKEAKLIVSKVLILAAQARIAARKAPRDGAAQERTYGHRSSRQTCRLCELRSGDL